MNFRLSISARILRNRGLRWAKFTNRKSNNMTTEHLRQSICLPNFQELRTATVLVELSRNLAFRFTSVQRLTSMIRLTPSRKFQTARIHNVQGFQSHKPCPCYVCNNNHYYSTFQKPWDTQSNVCSFHHAGRQMTLQCIIIHYVEITNVLLSTERLNRCNFTIICSLVRTADSQSNLQRNDRRITLDCGRIYKRHEPMFFRSALKGGSQNFHLEQITITVNRWKWLNVQQSYINAYRSCSPLINCNCLTRNHCSVKN
jgi:hypothetical protein